MEQSLPRGSTLVVVRGGNGRLGRVAAMLRKWNRPVITLMNRAVSVPLRGFRGLQEVVAKNLYAQQAA